MGETLNLSLTEPHVHLPHHPPILLFHMAVAVPLVLSDPRMLVYLYHATCVTLYCQTRCPQVCVENGSYMRYAVMPTAVPMRAALKAVLIIVSVRVLRLFAGGRSDIVVEDQ